MSKQAIHWNSDSERGGCIYPDREGYCGKVVDKGQKHCPYHMALDTHLKATRCMCDCHLAPPSSFLCSACGCPTGNHEGEDRHG